MNICIYADNCDLDAALTSLLIGRDFNYVQFVIYGKVYILYRFATIGRKKGRLLTMTPAGHLCWKKHRTVCLPLTGMQAQFRAAAEFDKGKNTSAESLDRRRIYWPAQCYIEHRYIGIIL